MTFDDLEIGQVILASEPSRSTAARSTVSAPPSRRTGIPKTARPTPWAGLHAVWCAAPRPMRRSPCRMRNACAVDALRWVPQSAAGRTDAAVCMTIMGKDPVGESKGVVIAQHDLLDEAGRLVFSCLTRSVVGR